MLPHEPSLPEPLAHAWEAVRADWQSEARHAAFIELCAQQQRLPDAGALYRGVKEREPAHAEQAEQQLQRIMARALVMLAQQAPQPVAPGARRSCCCWPSGGGVAHGLGHLRRDTLGF
jgi:hypothetical protein